MLRVLIDTNALVYAFDGKKDIYSIFDRSVGESFRFYTLDSCMGELEMLGRKDVAKWIHSIRIEVIDTERGGKTDDKILSEASDRGFAVLTEDKELIERALSKKLRVIRIAGNNLIML
jgi:rRNA-processing protein FCF1